MVKERSLVFILSCYDLIESQCLLNWQFDKYEE